MIKYYNIKTIKSNLSKSLLQFYLTKLEIVALFFIDIQQQL